MYRSRKNARAPVQQPDTLHLDYPDHPSSSSASASLLPPPPTLQQSSPHKPPPMSYDSTHRTPPPLDVPRGGGEGEEDTNADLACLVDGGSPEGGSEMSGRMEGPPALTSLPPSSSSPTARRRGQATPTESRRHSEQPDVVNLVTPSSVEAMSISDAFSSALVSPTSSLPRPPALSHSLAEGTGVSATHERTTIVTPEAPMSSSGRMRASVIQHAGPRRSRGDHSSSPSSSSIGSPHHRGRAQWQSVTPRTESIELLSSHPVLIVGHLTEAFPSPPSPSSPSAPSQPVGGSLGGNSTHLPAARGVSSSGFPLTSPRARTQVQTSSPHFNDHSYSLVGQLADSPASDDLRVTEHSYSLASIGAVEAPPQYNHTSHTSLRRSNRLSSRLGANSSSGLRLRGQGMSDASASNATELSRTGLNQPPPPQAPPPPPPPLSVSPGAAEEGEEEEEATPRHTSSFSISDLLVLNSGRRRQRDATDGELSYAPAMITVTPRLDQAEDEEEGGGEGEGLHDPLAGYVVAGGAVGRTVASNPVHQSGNSASEPVLLSPEASLPPPTYSPIPSHHHHHLHNQPPMRDTTTSHPARNVSSSFSRPRAARTSHLRPPPYHPPPPPPLYEPTSQHSTLQNRPPIPTSGSSLVESPGSEFLQDLSRQSEMLTQSLDFIDSRSRSRYHHHHNRHHHHQHGARTRPGASSAPSGAPVQGESLLPNSFRDQLHQMIAQLNERSLPPPLAVSSERTGTSGGGGGGGSGGGNEHAHIDLSQMLQETEHDRYPQPRRRQARSRGSSSDSPLIQSIRHPIPSPSSSSSSTHGASSSGGAGSSSGLASGSRRSAVPSAAGVVGEGSQGSGAPYQMVLESIVPAVNSDVIVVDSDTDEVCGILDPDC